MNYSNMTITELEGQQAIIRRYLDGAHYVVDRAPPAISRQEGRDRLANWQDYATIVRCWLRIKRRLLARSNAQQREEEKCLTRSPSPKERSTSF